jgi:hypothetical protein
MPSPPRPFTKSGTEAIDPARVLDEAVVDIVGVEDVDGSVACAGGNCDDEGAAVDGTGLDGA